MCLVAGWTWLDDSLLDEVVGDDLGGDSDDDADGDDNGDCSDGDGDLGGQECSMRSPEQRRSRVTLPYQAK